MATPMSGQKSHLAAFQITQNKAIRRVAERSCHPLFANIRQAGH
jgi:hypothetical protein